MLTFKEKAPLGLGGLIGRWRKVTGFSADSGGFPIHGPDVLPGDDVEHGWLIAEIAPGRHVEGWWGVKFHIVTGAGVGLKAVSNGWWDLNTEMPKIGYAIHTYLRDRDGGTEVLIPRTSEGRRRGHTSASQVERWLQCPGSVRLSDEVAKPRTSSVYADEGTAAHELAEMCLMTASDATDLVGLPTAVGIDVTERMADGVQVYLDAIRADRLVEKGSEFYLENGVTVDMHRVVLHGTFDAMIVSPKAKLIQVYDLKFGSGILVDVKDNAQLKTYGLGAFEKLFPMLGSALEREYDIELVIVQPRRADSDGSVVHRQRMPLKDLLQWQNGPLTDGVAAFLSPDAAFNPSVSACRWCDASSVCKAFEQRALRSAQEVFSVIADDPASCADCGGGGLVGASPVYGANGMVDPGTDEREPCACPAGERLSTPLAIVADALPTESDVKTAAASLTPDRLAAVMGLKPLVELWLKTVAQHVHARLESGEDVPGYKLVQKLGNRAWKDPSGVCNAIANEAFPSARCFSEPKLLSPAQMEKALKAAGFKIGKQIVAPLVHKPDRGAIVVAEADKRPALATGPGSVFDDLTGGA